MNAAPNSTLRAFTREVYALIEPIHAVAYFSPEPVATLKDAGYRGYWMGYFAQRAAPLGPVGPEIVQAIFYNFTYERVAKALPDAWSFASPDSALEARQAGSVAALRRNLGELAASDDLERAADLAQDAAASGPVEGRVLAAANRAVPVPSDPLARLWQATTFLREHRGDGHVATLLAEGVDGREAHVLHSLATGSPRGVYTVARDFTNEEWAQRTKTLEKKGFCGSSGITDAGRATKRRIEQRTDDLASESFAAVSAAERTELLSLLRPIAEAVVRGGDIPEDSPMGLSLRGIKS